MPAELKLDRTNSLVHYLWVGLAFLGAYLLLDRISFIHHLEELNITPWNPQPALSIALIALLGRRWIAWVFVTVLAAEFVVRELTIPLPSAVLLTAILTAGYAGIAWMLRGPLEILLDLSRRQDVLRLAAAIVLGAGVTGFCYVGALCIGQFIPWSAFGHALFRFWVGDSIGVLVTLPLLLFLADGRRRHELARLMRKRETLLQAVVVIAALYVVFARAEAEQFKYFYVLFLPLIWIAARHGLAGAICAVAMIQAGIIVTVEIRDQSTLTVIELQTLLLSLVLTGLFVGVTVDEWRYASERLERARQLTAAGEMATALAHELNQPLTALSTYADAIRLLASAPGANQAPLTDTAERIRRVATRCSETVSRIRGIADAAPNRTERTPIAVPIQSAIENVRERSEQIGATIALDIEEAMAPLAIDAERMTFVFQSLLSNALDAIQTRPAGERCITVRARRDGRGRVRVTVLDSGNGIAAKDIERIFEPFYSGKAQGMGLGLAISRSIVESHNGQLCAEPAAHGIFHVRLPL